MEKNENSKRIAHLNLEWNGKVTTYSNRAFFEGNKRIS